MKFVIVLLSLCSMAFATETRTKVVIIDTGINFSKAPRLSKFLCNVTLPDLTGTGSIDEVGHGTAVASLIFKDIRETDGICFVPIKVLTNTKTHSVNLIRDALLYAAAYRAAFVNISMSGGGSDYFEKIAIQNVIRHGGVVSVSAGNNHRNLDWICNVFPACYDIGPNFYTVGALESGVTAPYSNYGKQVNVYVQGFQCSEDLCLNGTSAATASHTNMLIKLFLKDHASSRHK